MQLLAWTHATPEGFTLRGWHTPPSGKPLLHFLHGNGFCGRVYEPMLAHLAADFDLWLSDAQGHGDSDRGEQFVGWNRSAELAVQALKAHAPLFGPVPRYALGHSFGGVLTCLALAEHPELFERAVLLDPVILTPPLLWAMQLGQWTGMAGHSDLARKARARRQHWPDRDSARESLQGRGVYKGWSEAALQAFVDHALREAPDGSVELKCDPRLEAEIFSSAAQGLWAALARVKTPIEVIHADNTFPFIAQSVQQWRFINRHVSARTTPGGHCFMQENPAEAARLTRDCLLSV
ncbi:MAG: alpha/beta hydrolase [Rubrivivax sp.]|nr:MAG: alpha/beta hydrolase [Rubrivivax sp.]